MISLYHGCTVKYNGYKTIKGHTIEAICTAMVIGWDENTIYTDFKYAGERGGECFYCEPEEITVKMVYTDWRNGFHRSRLIGIIQPCIMHVNHQLIQASLFNQ